MARWLCMLLLRRSLLAGVPTPFDSFSSHPLPLLPRSRGLASRTLARAAAPPLPSPPATSRASWSVRGGFVPVDTPTRSIRRGRASPPASGLVQPRRWRRGEAWTCVKRARATMWKVGWRRTCWVQSPTRPPNGDPNPPDPDGERGGGRNPRNGGGGGRCWGYAYGVGTRTDGTFGGEEVRTGTGDSKRGGGGMDPRTRGSSPGESGDT
eukprot:scaffold587_cov339-Pavlova_lutheri.AAC.13